MEGGFSRSCQGRAGLCSLLPWLLEPLFPLLAVHTVMRVSSILWGHVPDIGVEKAKLLNQGNNPVSTGLKKLTRGGWGDAPQSWAGLSPTIAPSSVLCYRGRNKKFREGMRLLEVTQGYDQDHLQERGLTPFRFSPQKSQFSVVKASFS